MVRLADPSGRRRWFQEGFQASATWVQDMLAHLEAVKTPE
jgi:hypothetical protein